MRKGKIKEGIRDDAPVQPEAAPIEKTDCAFKGKNLAD
jgi:hypothetical protein